MDRTFAFLWRQREEIKQLIFRQTRQTAPLISASFSHKTIKSYKMLFKTRYSEQLSPGLQARQSLYVTKHAVVTRQKIENEMRRFYNPLKF